MAGATRKLTDVGYCTGIEQLVKGCERGALSFVFKDLCLQSAIVRGMEDFQAISCRHECFP